MLNSPPPPPPHLHPRATTATSSEHTDTDSAPPSLLSLIDSYSLEDLVTLKIQRFLQQTGTFYPDNLYHLMIRKMEKPLIIEVLKRTGSNQLQAAKILGINRLTLAKKMKLYDLSTRKQTPPPAPAPSVTTNAPPAPPSS